MHLSVKDNGSGMDRATLERIFEPFFTTKRTGKGTGLGLSVVHGIVRSHAGALSVDSERGRGTTFHIYLPACKERATAAETRAEQPTPHGGGEHILYLDDEEPLVYLTERFLQRLGYRVSGYTQADDALHAFRANPMDFDLVITDSNMPGACGLEVARELLSIRPDAAVVLTSGYLQAEDVSRAHALGVRDVVLKPNAMDELGPIVHRLIAGLH